MDKLATTNLPNSVTENHTRRGLEIAEISHKFRWLLVINYRWFHQNCYARSKRCGI